MLGEYVKSQYVFDFLSIPNSSRKSAYLICPSTCSPVSVPSMDSQPGLNTEYALGAPRRPLLRPRFSQIAANPEVRTKTAPNSA